MQYAEYETLFFRQLRHIISLLVLFSYFFIQGCRYISEFPMKRLALIGTRGDPRPRQLHPILRDLFTNYSILRESAR